MALTKQEKWKAVVDCDPAYDGLFFYGVKTTGIFCRPSCKSKEPLRHNVEFFDAPEQAKHIFNTSFANRLKLAAQMKELGISQNYLIHLFRQQFNQTPVEYINKLRVKQAAQLLASTDLKILNIALGCGFGSLSTFYELFKRQVGQTPNEYRKAIKLPGDQP